MILYNMYFSKDQSYGHYKNLLSARQHDLVEKCSGIMTDKRKDNWMWCVSIFLKINLSYNRPQQV